MANEPVKNTGEEMKSSGAWDQIAGKWKQFTGDVRKKWGDLTDDDMEQIKGNRDVLIGRIQERYGVAKEDAGRQVDEWEKGVKF